MSRGFFPPIGFQHLRAYVGASISLLYLCATMAAKFRSRELQRNFVPTIFIYQDNIQRTSLSFLLHRIRTCCNCASQGRSQEYNLSKNCTNYRSFFFQKSKLTGVLSRWSSRGRYTQYNIQLNHYQLLYNMLILKAHGIYNNIHSNLHIVERAFEEGLQLALSTKATIQPGNHLLFVN